MPLTRKTLIDTLQANGLTGDVTLESCKAHVAKLSSQGVDLQDDAGNAIDVDAIWTAKSVIRVAGEADAARGTKSPHGAIAEVGEDRPQRFSIGNSARKAYAAKVAQKKAAFDDADHAEVFGAWARSTIFRGADYAQKKADLDIVGKAQVDFNNQLGGALVPIEFIPNLIWLTEQYGIARKLANVVPMSRDVAAYPRKTGINSMSPILETGTITAADNSYGNVTLVAKKYGTLYQLSRELLADAAVNIADDIARSIAEAQAIAEDNAYFLGDGTSTYANQIGLAGGLSSASSYIAATGAWSAFTNGDFNKLMGSVEYVNPSRLAFVCSRQFFAQVMMRLDKQTSQFKELSTGNLGDGFDGNAYFMGYPVYFSQVMPTATGSTGTKSVYFGDFTGASMLGDRKQLEIMSSDQYYFNTDSLAIRGISRFCVAIHGAGRGETYGAICGLKTA